MSKCKGLNCKAVDGVGHSDECLMDHNLDIHHNAGNNHPDYRYLGYKNRPHGIATDEQQAAWWSGRKAALYPPYNSISTKENVGKDAQIADLKAENERLKEEISNLKSRRYFGMPTMKPNK